MNPTLNRRRLRRLGFVIVAGYFLVGWWPFDFRPANQVCWLNDRPGLHFENRGMAYDPVALPASGLNPATASAAQSTIELWVAADGEPGYDVFDLLTIHNPRLASDLVLCQWQREIILRVPGREPLPVGHFNEVGARGALPEGKARFITVCSSGAGTDFYLDGLPAETFPGFMVNAAALDGQLILGADGSGKHPWAGRLFGLALYDRALGDSEVAAHHAVWTQGRVGALTNASGLRALYQFEERSGRQTQDASGHRHQIIIPASYEPLHREFLIPPWKDMAYRRLNYSDIGVNIFGFVPFGFCFFLCRQVIRRSQAVKLALLVVFAGAVVSLTIELIQAWLPSRVSSATDLLANTLGALLGVILALSLQRKMLRAASAAKRIDP